jgi:hypothetical protein
MVMKACSGVLFLGRMVSEWLYFITLVSNSRASFLKVGIHRPPINTDFSVFFPALLERELR